MIFHRLRICQTIRALEGNRCSRLLSARFASTSGCTTFQDDELSTELRLNIDKHWRDKLPKSQFKEDSPENKYYVLPMFPYPSGHLHMGHVRVYTISDAMARFYRLNGKNVLHPIGWDAFGLPAENAAMQRKVPADQWTAKNIDYMRKQLNDLAISFDWSREISTCDPDYYKWTQWLFLQLYKEGLAYQSEAQVNWDPVDKTVLANEQIDANGRSWRSGAIVEKKLLKQWFIRTTKYSKQLYDGLSDPALKDWQDVVKIQQHWIGECNGFNFDLELFYVNSYTDEIRLRNITVWTDSPEHLTNVGFIAIRPTHVLNAGGANNTRLDVNVKNPFNKDQLIPIVVTNEVEYAPFAETYVGIPSIKEADRELADRYWLSYDATPPLAKHRSACIKKASQNNFGGFACSSKLKDWIISRQRSWGTPIPMIHCVDCGTVPVRESDLPVVLPEYTLTEDGEPLALKDNKDWHTTDCPKCRGPAKRETDTIDTFGDSSWYFLRYLNPKNNEVIFNKKVSNKMMPVDLYVGGKEHAELHLYYARFVNHFLFHLGMVPQKEPFQQLLTQGMVMGRSFQRKGTGEYLHERDVEITNSKANLAIEKATGQPVDVRWDKMSKSKNNGVDPEELLSEHGCDTIRLIMLGDVAPMSQRNWSKDTFPGVFKWQNRMWLAVTEFNQIRQDDSITPPDDNDEKFKQDEAKLFNLRNHYSKNATFHFRHSHHLSVAITFLQGLTKQLRVTPKNVAKYSPEYERALCSLIVMISPLAPHFASELWSKLRSVPNRTNESKIRWDNDVLEQSWPEVDPHCELDLIVKLNGADKGKIKYPRSIMDGITEKNAIDAALKLKSLQKFNNADFYISKSTFNHYPGISATLNIIFEKKSKPESEKDKSPSESGER